MSAAVSPTVAGYGTRSRTEEGGEVVLERFRLDGQVAIVTGAGRGIGAAIASTLAEAGADVVIGARTADQLAGVAATIEAHGRQAVAVDGDLDGRTGLALLILAADGEFAGVDIVVNNLGGAPPAPFLDTSEMAFAGAFAFNVTSAFNLTQLAVPSMVSRGGGSVINIASTAGQFAIRGLSAYGTAKAALIHLTRELAQDLAPRIRVNAVAPGAIATSALDGVLANPRIEEAMVAGTPMRRIGDPEEVASAVLYFASPAAAYTTGQVLAVSGGIQGSSLEMPFPDV